jgi:hypothetical protein
MMIPIYNILQYNLLSVGFSVAPRRPEASLGSRTPRQQNSGDAPRVSSERRGRHTFGRRPMVRNRLSIQDLKKTLWNCSIWKFPKMGIPPNHPC